MYTLPRTIFSRDKDYPRRIFGIGESLRDWKLVSEDSVIFVYDDDFPSTLPVIPLDGLHTLEKSLWTYRTTLRKRKMFGKSPEELGLKWFEFVHFIRERANAPLSIAFAFVATHNHF